MTLTCFVAREHRAIGGLLLGLLLLPVGASSAQAQLRPTLTGTVAASESGKLLRGARVQLERVSTSEIVRTQLTGAGGTFDFGSLRPGDYVLEVQLLGYKAYQRPLTLELGEPTSRWRCRPPT